MTSLLNTSMFVPSSISLAYLFLTHRLRRFRHFLSHIVFKFFIMPQVGVNVSLIKYSLYMVNIKNQFAK